MKTAYTLLCSILILLLSGCSSEVDPSLSLKKESYRAINKCKSGLSSLMNNQVRSISFIREHKYLHMTGSNPYKYTRNREERIIQSSTTLYDDGHAHIYRSISDASYTILSEISCVLKRNSIKWKHTSYTGSTWEGKITHDTSDMFAMILSVKARAKK